MIDNNKDIQSIISNYNSSSAKLKERFEQYKSGRRLRVVVKSILAAFISAAALLIVFLLVERTPIQSEVLRRIFAGVLYGGVICWLHRLYGKWFNGPSDVALAVEIENSSDRFNSGLSSAVEFMSAPSEEKSISGLMKKLTISSVGEELSEDDVRKALKAFSRKKRAWTSIALIVIILGWCLISPIEVKTGAMRLAMPFASIAPWSNLTIDVMPKNAVAAVGENLEITATLSRRVDETIILELINPENNEVTKVEMYPDASGAENKYAYSLTSLQNSMDYRVTAEKVISEKYSIKVMARPQVKKVIMTLYQPSYISPKPVILPENTNEVEILTDSKMSIFVEADMPLAKGQICFSNMATETCQILGDKFKYEFNVATSTSFFIMVQNEIGLSNEKPVVYTVTAKPDLPPEIDLLKPGCDIEFPTTKMLEIKAIAKDDFGVKAMVLHYKAGHRDDWKPLNVKSDFTPVPDCEIEFPWMLDTIAVQPGTKISYYMEAEDARQPKPNVASTPIFFVNMPSMQDVYKGQEAQQNDLKQQLDEYVQQQKMRSESLKKAYEQIKHEEKLDFESTQAIEEAIKNGEKLQTEAEELKKSFENVQNMMENNPFTSQEALDRMQKVNELLDQVLDKDAKQKMQQLREALKDMKIDPKDIQKYEEAFKLDDYMKSLDRTINLLEQVREQQKFESLSNSIEEAYKRQQQIASETQDLLEKQKSGELSKEEEQKLQDLQDQQQKLNKDLEELQKKSEEMVKNSKNQDLKNNPMLEDVKNIADRLKNNDHKKMGEEIQKDMQNKELDKAQQNQEKMLEFLEALKKNADQIKQMCMAGATQLDLSSYIRRAVQVSVDQEKLLNEIIDMPESFMRGQQPQIEGIIDFVSVQQVLVKQQGRTLQEDLDKLITSSFGIDPTVIEAISGTQTRFSNIVKNLEDRALSQAWNDQYEIIRCFNKLAGDLMRAQDGQGQGQGSSSSPMSAMQQFKNLTQRQLSLYQQMMQQQLMPQGSEALKQMAMEQRHIRESLEQLMREHRQQMNSLGRMNDVIDDMKDVETKILDPKMREKVKEKQKSIYDRMMRSQKAIKNRDEEDEERQAQKARELHQQEPEKPIGDIGSSSVDLSKDFTGDLREEYPESYKQLLNEYYKSLNIYGGEQK